MITPQQPYCIKGNPSSDDIDVFYTMRAIADQIMTFGCLDKGYVGKGVQAVLVTYEDSIFHSLQILLPTNEFIHYNFWYDEIERGYFEHVNAELRFSHSEPDSKIVFSILRPFYCFLRDKLSKTKRSNVVAFPAVKSVGR